jgi:hypothetical protein
VKRFNLLVGLGYHMTEQPAGLYVLHSEAEAECAALRETVGETEDRAFKAESEVGQLRAEVAAEQKAAAAMVKGARDIAEFHLRNSDAEYDRRVAAETRLAAANELLERGQRPFENRDAYLAWDEDVSTFLAAQPAPLKPPNERSEAERAALFPCLEKLSNALCQTQGHILRALEQSGLSVVLSAQPAAPAYGSSPVGGANLRPEHRPTIAELIAAKPAAPDIKTESYCGFEYPSAELSHAQPPAPVKLGCYRCPVCDDPLDSDHPKGQCVPCHELPAAPARTEAEQRVLDAMERAHIAENDGYEGPTMTLDDEYVVCRAELARREDEPSDAAPARTELCPVCRCFPCLRTHGPLMCKP